jgi:succinyl-CoA synthetase beta subunit
MKQSISENIERALKKAHNEQRYTLFEHEVYGILSKLGVRTPAHIFIKNEKNITANTLSIFSSDRIVLKVAAKGISHKQEAGGVKVVYKDLDFVKYSYNKMRSAIENLGAEVSGILLAEYIEYSKDLGNEILLGFRESEAFGPVISFSKGGTDAEHFVKNFSPPNLILAPIDKQWARALLESTRIQKKYVDEGNTDYIEKIVATGVVFSDLAVHFSNFFPGKSMYVLKEFEVNPFIFDHQGNFVAIDGYAHFEVKADEKPDLAIPLKQTLTPFFEPESGKEARPLSIHSRY